MRVALLGLNSASEVWSFTAATTIWFADLTWTPSTLQQAEARCHRQGQMSAQVTNLYFVAKGTLDEDMWQLIQHKFVVLGKFVDGKDGAQVVVNEKYDSQLEIVAYVFPGSRL